MVITVDRMNFLHIQAAFDYKPSLSSRDSTEAEMKGIAPFHIFYLFNPGAATDLHRKTLHKDYFLFNFFLH